MFRGLFSDRYRLQPCRQLCMIELGRTSGGQPSAQEIANHDRLSDGRLRRWQLSWGSWTKLSRSIGDFSVDVGFQLDPLSITFVLLVTVVGGLSPTEYFTQTVAAIGWNHIMQGLISATVFGAIVAVSGCLRGMQSGRSAAAVGEATTSAVVTSIVFIVIASAGLTIVFDAIGLS